MTAIAAEAGGAVRTPQTVAIAHVAPRPVADAHRTAITDLAHAPYACRFLCDAQVSPPDTIDAIPCTDALDAACHPCLWLTERPGRQPFGPAGIYPPRGESGSLSHVQDTIEPIKALSLGPRAKGPAAAAMVHPTLRSDMLTRGLGFSTVRSTVGTTDEMAMHVLELEGSRNECPDRT